MESKKVLMVAASLRTGGAEKVARDIGLYRPAGYEVHYLVFEDGPGDYEETLTAAGCRILRIPKPGKNYPAHFAALLRLMDREGYQIVHDHTMFHCGFSMAAAFLTGVPVRIAHAHSELREGGVLRRIYETLMGLLIRRCSTARIACSTEAGQRLFGKQDFQIVPNGIDCNAFIFNADSRQAVRRELGWENCRIVGHAGRLNRVKNQGFLLRLLPDLLAIGQDVRLLLLGEGEDRGALEREISRLNLEEYVKMPGNAEEMGLFYSAMDVFAFPSLYEGMPLALLEARCSGLPCVISDTIPMTGPGIWPLPLTSPKDWVRALARKQGRTPCSVPDIRDTVGAIYAIYERDTP